jgi:protein-tyrosine phosphatase
MIPVIAHPERNPMVQADLSKIAKLVHDGALIQITAASLHGRLGKGARSCAEKLLDAELVHLLGSDAHNAGIREAGLSAARDSVGDRELARWLTEEVPRALVLGEQLPPRPERTKRPGFLTRLLGR